MHLGTNGKQLIHKLKQTPTLCLMLCQMLQAITTVAPKGYPRRGTPVRPLEGSSLANTHYTTPQSDDDVTFTAPLPAGLLTPTKHGGQQGMNQNTDGNHYQGSLQQHNDPACSPAARVSRHDAQYSLFDQSHSRVSFSTTCTPTSIFRRLKTTSPEGSEETQFKIHQFAHAQNVDPRGKAFALPPSGLTLLGPVPQKRSRPVQRGIHPAEINKRITGAQKSWQILDIVNTFGAEFDAVNVATALHRIAKQRPEDVPRLVSSDGFKQLVMMVDIQVKLLFNSAQLSAKSQPCTSG